ncbi:MAG: hypothetical protein FK733_18925 [Asgard group archaeon]|nr:hypothetical protein [Asgard group archaeon]
MWEFRVFFQEKQKNSLSYYKKVIDFVQSMPTESRTDYYYIVNDYSIGLKNRGVILKSDKPKLELKVLKDRTSTGCEYWLKPIRHIISESFDLSVGLRSEALIEILRNYKENRKQFLINKIDVIIQQLSNSEIIRLDVKKDRKQASYGITINNQNHLLALELTDIEVQKEKWITISVEGFSKIAIEHIAQQYLNEKNLFIMGYPQFLIEKIINNTLQK